MAIDLTLKRLFIGCHSRQMLVASYDGEIVASEFNPSTGLAFAARDNGTITVAHEDSPDKMLTQ